MNNITENPEVPPMVANYFSRLMATYGYRLDMSLKSLEDDLENIFNHIDVQNSEIKIMLPNDQAYDFETGIACYLGETLALKYGGIWKGHCGTESGVNFYTSNILFGNYNFNPFIYVGYRATNGAKDTGSVKELLYQVTRSMEDKVDYKDQEIKRLINRGKLVVDNKPWS